MLSFEIVLNASPRDEPVCDFNNTAQRLQASSPLGDRLQLLSKNASIPFPSLFIDLILYLPATCQPQHQTRLTSSAATKSLIVIHAVGKEPDRKIARVSRLWP